MRRRDDVCTGRRWQHRLDLVHLGQHRRQLGLGGDVEVVPDSAAPIPVRAQPHLGRRLLAGDVEYGAGLGHQRARLQQQRGLAHARLPGQQHHGPGDQAAAQHPVQFAQPGGPGARGAGIHLGDRHRAGGGLPVRPRADSTPVRESTRAAACSTVPQAWQPPVAPRTTWWRATRIRRTGTAARRRNYPWPARVSDGSDTRCPCPAQLSLEGGRAHEPGHAKVPQAARWGKEQC